ncbi:MAG: DUF1573 domain-containing protein [Thermoanaerobaculum sp.]|nr:DUF1573 domain-containing protein [Thermoanaerobaculum sp.]MDW7967922.1 DUF1573 domain-containing protein [Thermoanaerobaculum sp.]
MRRWTFCLLATVMAGVVWAQAPTAPSDAKPVADIPEKIKDFGVVTKGEKIRAVFEVRNTGKATLEVTQVRPTCGCTVAEFDRTIPPGGKGKLVAEVDTTDFTGPISKAVLVYTNDPAMPALTVVVKADVQAFIDVVPRGFVRLNVLQGEPAEEKVILVPSQPVDFKVLGVDTGTAPVTASFRKLEAGEAIPGRHQPQWEVSFKLPANAPVGVFSQKATVKTNLDKSPTVNIALNGVVRAIVMVSPPTVDLGTVPNDAPVGRALMVINNRQNHDLQIANAKVTSDLFTVEVTPLQPGQRYQVAVTLKAGAPKGTHKASLVLETNDPVSSRIEVPVNVTVQ